MFDLYWSEVSVLKLQQVSFVNCVYVLKQIDSFRITCSNQTSSNSKSVVVATQGSTSYKDNIASVFGVKQLQTILEINPEYVTNIKDNIFKGLSGEVSQTDESIDIEDVEIELSEDSNEADNNSVIECSQKSQGHKNVSKPIEFTGYISSCAHGSGRSSSDRQYFFINSRPCEPTKIIKIINEIYRQYNPNQYPFVFLNVNMERSSVDVNVTPDKRKIFLTKEKIILDILKNSILKLFESIPRTLRIDSSLTVSKGETNDVKPEMNQPRVFNSFLQQFQNKNRQNCHNESSIDNDSTKVELKRKSTTMLDFISSKIKKPVIEESKFEDYIVKEEEQDTEQTLKNTDDEQYLSDNIDKEPLLGSSKTEFKCDTSDQTSCDDSTKDESNILYLDCTDNMPMTQIRKVSDVIIEKSHTIYCKTKDPKCKENGTNDSNRNVPKKCKIVTDKEDFGKNNRKSVTLKTSLDQVTKLAEIYNKNKSESKPTRVKFKSEINPVFNKKCEEELSKEISKDSFKEMNVIGQFNLGFIITQLEDDLFIIDQHATDEIYNFETLQRTTELTSQKLVMQVTSCLNTITLIRSIYQMFK